MTLETRVKFIEIGIKVLEMTRRKKKKDELLGPILGPTGGGAY